MSLQSMSLQSMSMVSICLSTPLSPLSLAPRRSHSPSTSHPPLHSTLCAPPSMRMHRCRTRTWAMLHGLHGQETREMREGGRETEREREEDKRREIRDEKEWSRFDQEANKLCSLIAYTRAPQTELVHNIFWKYDSLQNPQLFSCKTKAPRT